jgi:hypothetical protein
MSTYELAAPYFERTKRDPRILKAAAALALRSAKEKAFKPAMYSQEEVAARNQAFERAANSAGWLINNLTERLGQARELKGLRTMPDGRVVAIEHIRSSIVNKNGKKIDRDPNFSPWKLTVTGPDGQLIQAFQIKLNQGSSPQPAEILILNKKGEAQMADDLEGDIAAYNQVRESLDFLMAGLPDKSTKFTKVEALHSVDNVRGLHAHHVHSRPAKSRRPEVRLAA